MIEQEPELGLFQRARAREAFTESDLGLSSEGAQKVTWQKGTVDRRRRVQTEKTSFAKSWGTNELQTLGEMEEKYSCSLALHLLTLLSSLYNTTNWHVTSLVTQMVKHMPTMWETQVWSLGQDNPLEKEMATHSSILAWKIPWSEEPGIPFSLVGNVLGVECILIWKIRELRIGRHNHLAHNTHS